MVLFSELVSALWGLTIYLELRQWAQHPNDEFRDDVPILESRQQRLSLLELTQKSEETNVIDLPLGDLEAVPGGPGDNETASSHTARTSGPRSNRSWPVTDDAVSSGSTVQSAHVPLLSQQLLERTPVVQTSIPPAPDYVTGHQEGIVNRGLIASGGYGEVYSVLLLTSWADVMTDV